MSYPQKADKAELFDSLMTCIKVNRQKMSYSQNADLYQYPPLDKNGHFILGPAYSWVHEPRQSAPSVELLEGPLSLVDAVLGWARREKRSTMLLAVEQDRAELWWENCQLKRQLADAEKALLSPENAEPVIAKLLGLKEEE